MKLNFDLAQKFSKSIVRDLIRSSLAVRAKLVIRKENISSSFGSNALGSYDPILDSVGGSYELPPGLEETYYIKTLPIEQHGIRLSSFQQYQNYGQSNFHPYDMWVICLQNDVRIDQLGENKILFDFIDYAEIKGEKFKVKGKFLDSLSSSYHIFLM